MRVILGIDAAWSAHHDSGVALTTETASGWRLIAVAPSYAAFLDQPPGAGPALAGQILDRAEELAGAPVSLVTVDMPLSRQPITARRVADNRLSQIYGGRGAGTHSPTPQQPGQVSTDLRDGFVARGYHLKTAEQNGALAEVYPHPALIEYLGADYRLPYKQGNLQKYWPALSAAERHAQLRNVWAQIVTALQPHVSGIADLLPVPDPAVRGKALKAYEDMLDAAICAAVGVSILRGEATPYGDADAAIWVPLAGAGAAMSDTDSMIRSIDHIVLTVCDIDAACAFYARVLDLPVVSFGNRRALQVGNQKINLQTLGQETRNHAAIGSGDVCLITDWAPAQVLDRLTAQGVAVVEGPVVKTGAQGPITSIYFNDPDGNLIEIASYH